MDQRQLAKKTSNALERLDQLEQVVMNIVSTVNSSLSQLNTHNSNISEVMDAVVQTLGTDTIQKIMSDNRVAKAEAQAKAEASVLAELLSKGDVKAAEKISDKSIVVGREFNKDGTMRPPGRVQVAFSRIEQNFQAGFLNQSVGFSLDLPNGGRFEVMEVYDVVEKDESTIVPPTVDSVTEQVAV